MKIVIVSDTHGSLYELQKVLIKENDADCYLHAGDIGDYQEGEIGPFRVVRGNCDHDFTLPSFFQMDTPAGPLYMRHRPLMDEDEADEFYIEGYRIFVHGHTHIKEDRKIGNILSICPGSLVYPRDGNIGSYVVLYIDGDAIRTEFKTI